MDGRRTCKDSQCEYHGKIFAGDPIIEKGCAVTIADQLLALRVRDDEGTKAVHDLKPAAQWAALEILIAQLGLRPLTQVDISAEKLKAFRKESE